MNMDLKDFEVSSFDCNIRALKETDYDKFGVSEGSIAEAAKSLLPEDFDPSANVDVLPVVFNLAVVNEFNKNGDGIDSETAVSAVKRFINKPINIEHKKHKIVGHMINASLSVEELDFKDNAIDSYAEKEEPFYINAAGLIYKNIFPELANAIQEAANEENEEYQSIATSWELAFKNYKVVYGSDRLDECEIAEGSQAEELKQYVKGFGGKGVDKEGTPVHRLIYGETYPLGAALTYKPAARVKGIYTSEPNKEEKDVDNSLAEQDNINIKNSLKVEYDVTNNKFDIFDMDKEQFETLMTQVAESVASVVKKDDQAASVGEIMRDALNEHSENWKSKVQLETEAREKAEVEMAELKASFEAVQTELSSLKSEVEAQAAVELFNSRMTFIDSTYELTEAELKLVVDELKSVEASDEAFDTFKEKLSILFASKTKEAIAAQEEEVKAKIEEAIASKLQQDEPEEKEEVKASEDELEIEEVEAAPIPNNNAQASEQISLVEKLKENFSVEVTK
jgi:hypothetical protein